MPKITLNPELREKLCGNYRRAMQNTAKNEFVCAFSGRHDAASMYRADSIAADFLSAVSELGGTIARRSKYMQRGTYSAVYISDSMSGKMHDIPSISTNCRENQICACRVQNPESICSHCFARDTLAHYSGANANTLRNNLILAAGVLNDDYLPRFKADVEIARFESFGDLFCWQQAANYVRIAAINSHVKFALWTKNPAFLDKAIKYWGGKPENLTCIVSSSFVNKPIDIQLFKSFYPWADISFTVYDKEFADSNGVTINCGARDCQKCRNCYGGKCSNVNELLK